MRSKVACAFLALALTACTRAGPPPPDFQATLEAIRIELTGMAAPPVPIPTLAPSPLPTATTPAQSPPTAMPTPTPTPLPSATPTSLPEPTPTAEPVTYVVQQGDYPGLIASKFGISVEALMEANGITDPRRLSIGQVLVIPSPEPE